MTAQHPLSQEALANPTVNAMEQRFRDIMKDPRRSFGYYETAHKMQWTDFGPDTVLTPLTLSRHTAISTTRALHVGIPVSLNGNNPEELLRYQFQYRTFIKGVTYTIIAPQLTDDGAPEAGFFEGSFDAGDFVYAQFERAGSTQFFQDKPCPLSEIGGKGPQPYLYNPIPAVQNNGTIDLKLSINPPGWTDTQNPPFVERIGYVTVSLHCEYINQYGV